VQEQAKARGGFRVGLLFVEGLTGFEVGGRVARLHGEHFSRMSPNISRIAVVTQKSSVMLAVSIARLIAPSPMKTFSGMAEARQWLALGAA
jgi:hypothetical protein